MKKALLFFTSAILLATLTGCVQIVLPPETSAQNVSDVSTQPEEEEKSTGQEEPFDGVSPEPGEEQAFDALEIDIEKGTMYIRAGDSFSYTREDGGKAEYEITDNTLCISQLQDHKTVLTLPEDLAYTSLRLTVGEGHVYTECALSLQTLELDVSRGEASLSGIAVSDSSAIEVRQGSAFLSGDPGASVTANSKEGHISMEVWTAQDDYNFEIDLSTGNIHVGSEDYHGLSASKSIDNGAERSMKLTCSRGDLSVEFDKP